MDTHPLIRFPKLKEPKKVFRPLTVQQFRDLVEAVDNPYLQAMVAVIGETGIRKGEALSLTWIRVDLVRRLLWVEFTKNDETREIPLSKYATGYLAGLVRYLNTPYVFVNSRTGTRWVNPDKPLRRAAERVGLKVGFHDLRRFRCSHWLMQGVDVRTVQKLMVHSAISTTMRYAGYVSSHALASIREAQANEDSQTQQATNRQTGRKQGEMIRGENWDNLLKRKDHSRNSSGHSNGFPIAHSSDRRLETSAPYQPVAKVITAFDRPCIPADGVAIQAHTPGMHPNRALSGGRRNGLGARGTFTTDCYPRAGAGGGAIPHCT